MVTPAATVGERNGGKDGEDAARRRGTAGAFPLFAWLRAWAEETSGETRVAAACWPTRVVREGPAWLLPAMMLARTCGDESKSWVVSSNILLRATLAGGSRLRGPAGARFLVETRRETRGARTYGLGFSYWLRLPHSCVPWISGWVPARVPRVRAEARGKEGEALSEEARVRVRRRN